ncbi:metallophosphoesterase family protein [Candidatus Micrarchaeota archaeon]|nr:metallophosphoesterase family protein [Candidatus Micrarchaeota archaeon]MBU1165579.1 metallophosphoesterase family protein [Candidatus Micrarchaeota archaeon]MBU1887390.1 metallophosphoesterase family protein [Candidatus Micrarchaeota archaeon]
MKILAFSDLHEEEVALESLRKISKDFDYVFICGDISHSVSFAEEVLVSFPNAFLIPGNWDNKQVISIFENTDPFISSKKRWIHEARVEIQDGINVVGFGYSHITSFGTYGELTESQIYERMSKLPIDKNTLLMLHSPPKGHFDAVNGGNAGSESILKIIMEKKPLAAFFGHIHEYIGVKNLGSTQLIKLPAAIHMQACSVSITAQENSRKINVEFIHL